MGVIKLKIRGNLGLSGDCILSKISFDFHFAGCFQFHLFHTHGSVSTSQDVLVHISKKGNISLEFSNLVIWQWWCWSTMLRSTRTTILAPLSYQSHLPETHLRLARWYSSESFKTILCQLAITGGWGLTGYQEGLSPELRSLELNLTSVWMKTAFWSSACTCCSGERYLDLYKRLWQRREGDGSLQRRFRRTSRSST